MRVPLYWARQTYTATSNDGRPVTRSALGWSFSTQAEAQQVAAERAERATQSAAAGQPGSGYYNALPLREPVLESIDVDGENVGLVTRNRYGCRVLNADGVMFADIDLTPAATPPTPGNLVRRFTDWLRGRYDPPAGSAAASPEQAAIERIAAWQLRNPGSAVRVYRTYAGLRLMFVHREYDPADPATLDVLRQLDSDPLYVHLTKRQECFRARLSPKPWRIGVRVPAVVSLADHPEYPEQLAAWAEPYEAAASQFSTCRLLQVIGPPAADPRIEAVVALHDRDTLNGDRPLA